jgi:hypothetical protein
MMEPSGVFLNRVFPRICGFVDKGVRADPFGRARAICNRHAIA